MTATAYPKSYLPAKERDALMQEGGMDLVYLSESQEAGRAGDEETAWQWLRIAKLSATSLNMLKAWNGAQYIRDMGFDTSKADAAFGSGWLDRQ